VKLDLAKLFPNACGQRHVKMLAIEFFDIDRLETKESTPAGFNRDPVIEHFIIMKNGVQHVFHDNKSDNGMGVLQEIGIALDHHGFVMSMLQNPKLLTRQEKRLFTATRRELNERINHWTQHYS
jgi:hypothetical protein